MYLPTVIRIVEKINNFTTKPKERELQSFRLISKVLDSFVLRWDNIRDNDINYPETGKNLMLEYESAIIDLITEVKVEEMDIILDLRELSSDMRKQANAVVGMGSGEKFKKECDELRAKAFDIGMKINKIRYQKYGIPTKFFARLAE